MEQGTRSRCALIALVLSFVACTAPEPSPSPLEPTDEQAKLRSYQSRTFEIGDRLMVMHGVMGALQDLGFLIERASEPLGLVTGVKFAEGTFLSIYEDFVAVTVTVRAQAGGQMLVRINAIHNRRPIDDPEVYGDFFAALERSLSIAGG